MTTASPKQSAAPATAVTGITRRLPEVLLAVALLVALVFMLAKGAPLTFWSDDWAFVMRRHGLSADTFLAPHNGHLALFPVIAYKAVFELWGLSAYWPLRALLLALHATVVILLFVYVRRRTTGWVALAFAAPMVFFASATEVMMYPFNIGYVGALAAGLGALLLLDLRTRRADLAASGLLVVALGSSTVGLPFAAGALIEILAAPDRRRRWWVAVVPIGLWALWRVAYPSGSPPLDKPEGIPIYVLNGLARSAGAPFGLGPDWGNTLVVALLVAVVVEIGRHTAVPARLWSAMAMAVLFWVSVAVARGDLGLEATERFLYPGTLFLLLVMAECVGRWHVSSRVWPLAAVAVVTLVLQNIALFNGQFAPIRDANDTVAGGLVGAELAGESADPGFQLPIMAYGMTVRDYRSVRSFLDSPVDGPAELRKRGGTALRSADRVLVDARVGIAPASATGGGRCVTTAPGADGSASVERTMPSSGLLIRARDAGVEVALRKFAPTFEGSPVRTVEPRTSGVLRVPPDPDPTPWNARLRSRAPFEVCDAG